MRGDWGAVAYPETFVIDRQGRVAAIVRGPVDEEFMREAVEPLLEERAMTRRGARWRSRSLALFALAAPAASRSSARARRSPTSRTRSCARAASARSTPSTASRRPSASARSSPALIDQCKSKEEIKAALVAQFGDDVLALPDDEGFDATAYIVPVAVPLARARGDRVHARCAGAGAGRRAPAARPPRAGDDAAALDPDDSARLDEDLERYQL